jgi:hypothetical protein
MRNFYLLVSFLLVVTTLNSQETKKNYDPYVAVYAGGCVNNPFQIVVGIQKPLASHLTIGYDLHFWKTGYESFCGDVHSKGKFTSITPSVKLTVNTGKQKDRGLMAGVGLGYVFAKDRGTVEDYIYDESGRTYIYSNIADGNWDFNSVSPSFLLGVGFRLFKLPVSFNTTYYFANTTEGWVATAGGVGFKVGLRKMQN